MCGCGVVAAVTLILLVCFTEYVKFAIIICIHVLLLLLLFLFHYYYSSYIYITIKHLKVTRQKHRPEQLAHKKQSETC